MLSTSPAARPDLEDLLRKPFIKRHTQDLITDIVSRPQGSIGEGTMAVRAAAVNVVAERDPTGGHAPLMNGARARATTTTRGGPNADRELSWFRDARARPSRSRAAAPPSLSAFSRSGAGGGRGVAQATATSRSSRSSSRASSSTT